MVASCCASCGRLPLTIEGPAATIEMARAQQRARPGGFQVDFLSGFDRRVAYTQSSYISSEVLGCSS